MEGSELIEILDVIFNAGYFLFLGSLVSLEKFALIGWGKLVLLSLWIIFIRRIPAALSFSKWIPSIKSRKDVAIVAWFAPVGGGAVLYTQICSELKTEMQEELLQIVLFVVIACIVLQGGSIPLFRSVLTDNDADDGGLREIIDRKDTV
jgi:NhaP-type Na+/H+ or K+/H+ antiporter